MNGKVRYELTFGTEGADKLFRVDALTGEIYTREPIIQASGKTFIMSVQAKDQPLMAPLSR